MKITGFEVVPFEVAVDRFAFGMPLPGYKVVQTLTKVLTDEGPEGHYFGGHFHGDQDGLLPGEQTLITQFAGHCWLAGIRSTGSTSGSSCGCRSCPRT